MMPLRIRERPLSVLVAFNVTPPMIRGSSPTRGASHFVAQSFLLGCSSMVPAFQSSPMLDLSTNAKTVCASVTPPNCVLANRVVPSVVLATTTWGPVLPIRHAFTVAVITPPPIAPPARDGWTSAEFGWSWRSIASLTLRPSASLLPPVILPLLLLLVLLTIRLNASTLPSLPDALHLCPDGPALRPLPRLLLHRLWGPVAPLLLLSVMLSRTCPRRWCAWLPFSPRSSPFFSRNSLLMLLFLALLMFFASCNPFFPRPPRPLPVMPLNIVHFNMRGGAGRLAGLEGFLERERVDIACLQETYFRPTLTRLGAYSVFQAPPYLHGHGVAIVARSSLR